MNKTKKSRPTRRHPADGAYQLLQAMPGNRSRVNPEVRNQLIVWLMVQRQQWENLVEQPPVKGGPAEYMRRQNQVRYARHCLAAVDQLIRRVGETVHRGDVAECKDALDRKQLFSAAALVPTNGNPKPAA